MKLVAAQADLVAHAALLAQLLREVRLTEGASELRPLVTYLLRTRGSERDLRAIMNATDSETSVIVQTAYEKLIERGRARGKAEGKAEMLLHFLQARFGAVPPEILDRIHDARVDQLDRWAQRLLTASTLDELFVD